MFDKQFIIIKSIIILSTLTLFSIEANGDNITLLLRILLIPLPFNSIVEDILK